MHENLIKFVFIHLQFMHNYALNLVQERSLIWFPKCSNHMHPVDTLKYESILLQVSFRLNHTC